MMPAVAIGDDIKIETPEVRTLFGMRQQKEHRRAGRRYLPETSESAETGPLRSCSEGIELIAQEFRDEDDYSAVIVQTSVTALPKQPLSGCMLK